MTRLEPGYKRQNVDIKSVYITTPTTAALWPAIATGYILDSSFRTDLGLRSRDGPSDTEHTAHDLSWCMYYRDCNVQPQPCAFKINGT